MCKLKGILLLFSQQFYIYIFFYVCREVRAGVFSYWKFYYSILEFLEFYIFLVHIFLKFCTFKTKLKFDQSLVSKT